MPNTREKLIDLIMSSGKVSGFAGGLADYLIANGVTIGKKSQKVKPRKRKHNAITMETFLAMEKIGQQTHKEEEK